mgnify:CR=1 FL=1
MKFLRRNSPVYKSKVAPFAGAWIEMMVALLLSLATIVAPFAGAWIEIDGTVKLYDGE